MVNILKELMFKQLTKSDLNKSAEIVCTAFNAISSQYGFNPEIDTSRIITKMNDAASLGATMIGAFIDGEQIGFVEIDEKDQEVYEVLQLSVLPHYQKAGYGQAILDKVNEVILAKGGVAGVCAIINDNVFLKNWLIKNGFFEEASGKHENFPCAICLMQKDLAK